jgi:hypothetical protein
MKRSLITSATALTLIAGLGAFGGGALADTYKVTVTNLTKGQVFNPTFVAAHSRRVSVFTPGEAASPELAALAEDADSIGLANALEAKGATVEVAASIPPGGQGTVYIKARGKNKRISVLGMLVTTNDGFYALNGVKLDGDSATYRVPAYDAGSEVNDEDCKYIPGPPCNTHAVGPREDGVVHIHNGIHGLAIADPRENGVNPETHDWRNPVAQIRITRVDDRRSKRDDDEDDDDD